MNDITIPESFIERAAKDASFDVAKFETLLRMRRDEAHDQSRRVFNAAMAACQSEMLPVLRHSPNPGTRSKYAKLEDIDQQMRPIYTRHGFSVRFGSAPPPQPGWMRVTCTVAHDSGYFEENFLDSPVQTTGSQGGRMAMTQVQAVGSVVTYLRRYLMGMVFNIVQADVVGEDDDGEGGRGGKPDPGRGSREEGTRDAMNKEVPWTRTDEQWRVWIDKLQAACAVLYRRAEVEEIGDRPTVRDAIANGPEWVGREISAILRENMARFDESAGDGPIPEPEPEPEAEPAPAPVPAPEAPWLARISAMGMEELSRLPTDATYRAELRTFSVEGQQAIGAAIMARKAELRAGA